MSRILLAAASAAAIACTAGAAQADTIGSDLGVFDASIEAFEPLGQTFIAVDPNLISIGFAYSDINPDLSNDPITLSLYAGGAGLGPGGVEGTLIASRTFTLPAVLPGVGAPPAFIDTDFSGVSLTVGDVYIAALTTTSFKVAVVYGADGYDGGTTINNLSGCGTGCDLDFRVVGSDGAAAPAGVPEPASWALMLTGVMGLGASLRARRRLSLVS
ncbi:PEP-CTERM sorting domain-containing protein [Phenylobacterium sp.]|uniref:PEP-CTERM sorting domain-containing protein n=1 Tax=Phenylobacterium sp. TaxID=1871053 RepID=UPI001221AF8C|nr:PEP-CTERM sorting domain-containing protein [Phenylobacterium sp.]THD64704.1 MAG: PEP-CTERM sorting domain-containing protein [Phenylobacterium sp.]